MRVIPQCSHFLLLMGFVFKGAVKVVTATEAIKPDEGKGFDGGDYGDGRTPPGNCSAGYFPFVYVACVQTGMVVGAMVVVLLLLCRGSIEGGFVAGVVFLRRVFRVANLGCVCATL